MRYSLTCTVLIALIIVCLLFGPAIGGGGRRATNPLSSVGLGAQADEVLLRDSFDRADSPQLGVPWLEAGEVTDEFTTAAGYHVGPARAEVSQGALSFSYANHSQKPQFPFTSVNGRPVVYAPLARAVFARPSVFSLTFEPHPDERIAHEAGLMSAASGFREVTDASGVANRTPVDGFGVAFAKSSTIFNNSQVSIIKYEGGARTILAERLLGLQFAYGKTYSISLTVAPDFSATVLVSDGVNTEQIASPTTAVSFPLDQFFIADVEGGISSDTREAGVFSLRFDDVTVREVSPAPTPTPAQTCFMLNATVAANGGGGITRDVEPNCAAGTAVATEQVKRPASGAVTVAEGSAAVRSAQAAETFRRLIEKAELGGAVRVIVGLNAPFVPEGDLRDARRVLGQREGISRAQYRVLGELSSSRVASVKKFPYIPYMALVVDAQGLRLLQSSPAVSSIGEDTPVPLSTSESVPLIGAHAAWAAGFSGTGQTVAILDSGVDKTHPFLAGKVVSEACYSTSDAQSSSLCPAGAAESTAAGSGVNCPPSVNGCDHGTHVAGIAAGRGGGGSGVAKDADIIAIQVFSRRDKQSDCGDSQTSPAPCLRSYDCDYIKGLQRVLELSDEFNIASVNMSLGSGWYPSYCDSSDATSAAIKASIDNLRSRRIATVVSSGNDNYKDGLNRPACISSAVSVGATDDGSSHVVCDFLGSNCQTYPTRADDVWFSDATHGSNIAPSLNLLAPGRWIYSSVPAGFDPSLPGPSFVNKQGTSMAAPHVAGAWAVLKSRFPSATVEQILGALSLTGASINGVQARRIRVDAALNAMAAGAYTSGSVVTLTAVPDPGYVFQSWSDCDSASGSNCSVIMNTDRAVTANFAAAAPTPTPTPTPTPSADLSITKTALVDPAEVGRSFTYNINVSNAGPDAANALTVTDALPSAVTFTSATPSQGACAFASGTLTCHLGMLAANGAASVALQVKPRQTGMLSNTASVTAAELDPHGSNNSATSNINVIKTADLKVSKSDSPDPIFVGEQVTYTMLVTNLGPLNTATGVMLTDTLPASMIFVSATTTRGSLVTPPVGSTGIVTVNIGALATGEQATVTVTVKAAQSGVITNTATVSGNETDINTANNAATQTTTVKDAALLKLLLAKQVLTGGCENTTGNVYLTGPAPPGGVNVALLSNVAGASVPSGVFIPAGQTVSSPFMVATSTVAAKQVGLVTATLGTGSVSRGITINVGNGSCQ
jgi:uncharacterized repeat protein (TIGR01451 family)